jgi:plastocyanin
MKSTRLPIILIALLLLGLGVYLATSALADNYLTKRQSTGSLACSGAHPTYGVTIRKNTVRPAHVTARRCDKLTITNYDDVLREMAFGDHEHHQLYDGIFEQNLALNQSFTITLNKTGTYRFHDHFQDSVSGTFTVTN